MHPWHQTDFLCRFKMASNTNPRKESDPRKDSAREATKWWQKESNTLQTFFHSTCEFPYWPRTPTAVAAPLAEKRSPTMCKSRTITANTLPPFPLRPSIVTSTRDIAAYEHAIAFDTTKYLQNKNMLNHISFNLLQKHKTHMEK